MNLILVSVIVCVTAGYLRSLQELNDERRAIHIERGEHDARLGEIKKLKDRLGILTIADQTRLYVKARQKGNEF